MFGTYDKAQLQRGFQVYKEVCSNCHPLTIPFRSLSQPGRARLHRGSGEDAGCDLSGHQRGAERQGRDLQAPGHPGGRFPASRILSERPGRRGGVRQGAARHEPARQGAQVRAWLPVVHLRRASGPRIPGDGRRLYPRHSHRLHEAGRSAVEPLLSGPQDRDAAADHGRRGRLQGRHAADAAATTPAMSRRSSAGRRSPIWTSAGGSASAR